MHDLKSLQIILIKKIKAKCQKAFLKKNNKYMF